MRGCVRDIRIAGKIAFVPLTKGYDATIDVDDIPLVAGRNWYAKVCDHNVYAKTDINGKSVFMHRVILSAKSGMYVDHIDGDGLNNVRRNLRECTPSQNQHNRKINANNSSGYKGVSFDAVANKWRARIRINGSEKRVGLHGCVTAAAISYALASEKEHGEFGRLK